MNTPSPSLCKGPVVIQLLENQKILKADEEPWYDEGTLEKKLN